MMNLTLSELDSKVENFFLSHCTEKPESLRKFLSDSPTQYQDVFRHFDLTTILIRTKRRRDLQRLALLSWYFPEEIRILVQLNLEEHWQEQDLFNIERSVLLTSKQVCLAWFLREWRGNENDFFGNVLNRSECQRVLRCLVFKKCPQSKVKRYTGYCRGYRESNSGAPRSFPRELEIWVQDENEFNEKVLTRQLKVDACLQRIAGFLEAS
jgi:hypothetical protein